MRKMPCRAQTHRSRLVTGTDETGTGIYSAVVRVIGRAVVLGGYVHLVSKYGWKQFIPAILYRGLIRRQRHKVSGIQGIGRLLGSLVYRLSQQTRYKALYFHALPLKAVFTPLTRATTPFQGFFPVLIREPSLKEPIPSPGKIQSTLARRPGLGRKGNR